MEEDFNLNNKILTRYLMQCEKLGGNIPKEQYVSRNGKIHYACCQQTTDLQHDTLTTGTCYSMQQ